MLKLAGIGPEHDFSRRVDVYSPIDIEISRGAQSMDELFYWRAKAGTHLLEIKVIAASGLIDGVSLVLVPRESTRVVDSVQHPRGLERQVGIPIVDVAPWKAKIGNREIGIPQSLRFVDEAVPFELAIGGDGVAITIASTQPASIVVNGALAFLFADDATLCGVTLVGLPDAELQLLRQSFV